LKTAESRDFPMEPIPLQDLLNIFRVKNTAADRYRGAILAAGGWAGPI
jgi:hypothetical protein